MLKWQENKSISKHRLLDENRESSANAERLIGAVSKSYSSHHCKCQVNMKLISTPAPSPLHYLKHQVNQRGQENNQLKHTLLWNRVRKENVTTICQTQSWLRSHDGWRHKYVMYSNKYLYSAFFWNSAQTDSYFLSYKIHCAEGFNHRDQCKI